MSSRDFIVVKSSTGLRIALGSAAGLYFSSGVVLLYTFSVFIAPIVQDTGWDRTTVAALIGPAALCIGLASPLVGWLTDRFSPRKVLIASAILEGVGVAMIGLLSSTLWQFGVLILIASFMSSIQTSIPYIHLIADWFGRQRGLAMGIALCGSGVGVATLPIGLAHVIAATDWRTAYVVLGMVALTTNLMIALFVLKDAPTISKQVDNGATEGEAVAANHEGHSFKATLKSVDYWLLLFAFSLTALLAAGGSILLPSILIERGVDKSQAALLMSAVGISMIFARVIVGWLLDHVWPITIIICICAAPLAGYLVLFIDDSFTGAAIAALLFGLAIGSEGDATPYILSRKYGHRAFGRIYGVQFIGYAVATGYGAMVLSGAREMLGDNGAFMAMMTASFAAILASAIMWKRPLPYA